MRWFKHMSLAAQDEKLALLQSEFGLAGYGFFWRVLETIACQTDGDSKNYCEYPTLFWRKSLGISHKKFYILLKFCEEHNIFSVSQQNNVIRIGSAGLIKYRDEWSRKKEKIEQNRLSNMDRRNNMGNQKCSITLSEEEDDLKQNRTAKNPFALTPPPSAPVPSFVPRKDEAPKEITTASLDNSSQSLTPQIPEKYDFKCAELASSLKPDSTSSKPSSRKKIILGSMGNVLLLPEEHARLREKEGEERTRLAIEKLDAWIGASGSKYKSHYAVMYSWVLKAVDKEEGCARSSSNGAMHGAWSPWSGAKHSRGSARNYAEERLNANKQAAESFVSHAPKGEI